MKVTELFTIEELDAAIARGLISKRKHPTLPLYILNYTAEAQWNWEWTAVTLNCRGLVIDEDYNIIARSLPKFFSYEQLDGKLPEGNFVVEEKLDGSMLLVFKYKGNIVTATRGSFESDQAIKGKTFLPGNFDTNEGYTWIFEVIYKENRVVVDYDFEGLVLLAIVWADGTQSPNVHDYAELFGFRSPKRYSFESLEEILNYKEDNLEGFVLRYINLDYDRVKIKLEEYKRLHRLITGVSEKTVWEAMKEGKLPELLENVPDEFYRFVQEVKQRLEDHYNVIENDAKDFFVDLGDRKANALFYQNFQHPGILFHMLDGKDYSPMIWKLVRPEVTSVFKMVSEDSN